MNNTLKEIVTALIYFGPMDIKTIHDKLKNRDLVVPLWEIEQRCRNARNLIMEASGFNGPAFRIRYAENNDGES